MRKGFPLSVKGATARLDRLQQRRPWLGFPLAVQQKYGDDQGGYLAATVTYYGFFSLFPLLLVLTTGLGYALRGHPGLQRQVVDSVLGQLPVIGRELRVGTLHGNALALALGAAAALWSGTSVFLAVENALDHVWGVPFARRSGAVRKRLRALILLVLVGGSLLVTTGLAAVGSTGGGLGIAWQVGSALAALVVNAVVFAVAFRVLPSLELGWECVWRGAVTAAVAYEGLQLLGGYYVAHTLRNASNVYGTFALVIGLLTWIYLAAHVILLAAEVDVVYTRRLWPRSLALLGERPSTPADREALEQRAGVEQRRPEQEIDVSFGRR
jgi:YihY family inner membrane protein